MSISPLPHKTLADYLALAVCPVLVMGLVGSVIFFLLAVGYAGSHEGTLRWTFFWFVLAMVLVSRIAIERGSEHAGVYGFCLAAATGFVLVRYVGFHLGMGVLLGLIWWATNKLTWDCTVIDEDEDASGEGLLQAAKIERQTEAEEAALVERASTKPQRAHNGPDKPPAKVAWWERGLGKTPKQPHAPGMWVIYFSLAALPIFGLGESLLTRQALGTRQYAFFLLALYLVAALGLLLATSFLGLRRYLRQRYLQMPSAMAATWLATGTVIASAILLVCLLLPRPSTYWSFSGMLSRLGDRASGQPRQHTAASWLPPALGAGTNREGGQSGQGRAASTRRSNGESSQVQDHQSQVQESGAGESPRPPAALPSALVNWLRLAVYSIAAAAALVLLLKNWSKVLLFLSGFWQAFLAFWSHLFTGRQKSAPSSGGEHAAVSPLAFASFTDPFASGEASRMSAQELVVHTFRGLEAWGAQHACSRSVDQTPFEFADRLAAEVPDLAEEARQVARLYAQVAYAHSATLPPCQTLLEILWSKMTRQTTGA